MTEEFLKEAAAFDFEPSDRCDIELIDRLKIWITDMLESIGEKDICSVAVCIQPGFGENGGAGLDVSFAYNTDSYLKENYSDGDFETKWNFLNWKDEYSGSFHDIDNWVTDKGIDLGSEDTDTDGICEAFMLRAVYALKQLKSDNTILKLLGRDIPVIVSNGLEYYDFTALCAAAVNDLSLLDDDFFAMCGVY